MSTSGVPPSTTSLEIDFTEKTMNDTLWIEGAGGGDSPDPTRTPDSLLSQDYFEVLLAISQGPIKGLVSELPGSLENFYAGDTPAFNLGTNTANFADVVFTGYSGSDTDPAIQMRLGGSSANLVVSVPLSQNIPVVRQTPASQRNNFDCLEIRLVFAYLAKNNNGGSFETTARLRISYKRASSPVWIDFEGNAETLVTGKTTANYAKEFVIPVAQVNEDYDIRVIKLSPDGVQGVDEDVAIFSWESVQMVKRGTLQFDNLACVHIYGKASNQFSSLPEFSGVYDGLIIKVPSNYNPVTRTYDETTPWNGVMKDAHTSSGVWVLYALITDPEFGLARYYKGVSVNRFDFYDESKWCDEKVPDGRGGEQFRYTFNDLLAEPKSGLELIKYVAGSFGAIVEDDGNGNIYLRSDRPRTASCIFTPENVTPDGFNYTFTDIPTRYNEVTATFVNPDLDWAEDRRSATIDNTAAIAANGRIPYDFVAVGCTDAQEAVRRANIRFISANEEITSVGFTTTRAALLCGLYDTILVADPLSNWSSGGRLRSRVGNTLNLRDPIFFPDTNPRGVIVQTFEGLSTVTVVPPGIGASYSLSITAGTLPATLPDRTVFTVQDATGLGFAKPFRVMGISEVEGNPDAYQVVALEIAEGKHEAAANGAVYTPSKYAYVTPGEPTLPLDFTTTTPLPVISNDGSIQYQIEVSFRRPISAATSRFEIDFKLQNSARWQTVTTYTDTALLSPVADGDTYVIRLWAVSALGNRSQKCVEKVYTVVGHTSVLENVQGLTVTQDNTGWRINWSEPVNTPAYDQTEIRVGAPGNNYDSLARKYRARTAPQRTEWLLAATHRFFAKYYDTAGNSSDVAAFYDVVVLPPATPIMTVVRNLQDTTIQIQDCTTTQPLKKVHIRTGVVSDTWDTAVPVTTGAKDQRTFTVIPNATTATRVYMRAEDAAGNLSNTAVETIPAAAGSIAELLRIINDGIIATDLSPDLLGEVELISAPSSVPGSVNSRITQGIDALGESFSQQIQQVQSNALASLGHDALNLDPYLRDPARWESGGHGPKPSFESILDGVAGVNVMSGVYQSADEVFSVTTQVGRKYRISCLARAVGNPNGFFYLRYVRRQSTGQFIEQGFGPGNVTEGLALTPSWVVYSFDLVAVAADAYISPRVILNYGGTVGFHQVQNVRIVDVTEVTLLTSVVSQEINTRAAETGYLGANWALKVALINGNSTAEVGGIAISGTSTLTAGSRFDMAFRANAFSFLPPSGQGNTPSYPMVYYTTPQVVNGITVSPGLYLKSIFVETVTADRIDARGLSIKDLNGNVILAAGTPLTDSYITPASGWVNSNIVLDGAGNIVGIGAGNGTNVANNVDGVIRAPVGGYLNVQSGTVVGALKVTLPQFFTYSMLRFTLEVIEFSAGYSFSISIAGYTYAGDNTWREVSATVNGGSNVEYPVYFGHDGSKCCVWIGGPTTSWDYPQAKIKDVLLGYISNQAASWSTGWALSFDQTVITNGPGANQYSASVLDTLPGADWSKTARRPANVASLTGTEDIRNSQIAIGANGAITGIGSGSGALVDNSAATIGQNLFPNSDATLAHNWTLFQTGAGVALTQGPGYSDEANGWNGSNYALAGGKTRSLFVLQDGVAPGGDFAVACDLWDVAASAVVNAGDKVCVSVYVQAHRCKSSVYLAFMNAQGGAILYREGATVEPLGGIVSTFENMARASAVEVAPAGTAFVRIHVRKYNTLAGQPNSYFWWAAPQIEVIGAKASGPSPYQSGPASSTRQLGYTGELDATKGAQSGVNLKDASGAVLSDPAIKNSAVTLTSAGALQGAGGGQVTITGLGYTGSLNASNDLQMILPSGYVQSGGRITKASGADAADTMSYAKVAYKGGAFIEATIACDHFFIGLTDSPSTSNSYPQLKYSLFYSFGNLLVYENGAQVKQILVGLGSRIAVVYEGNSVRYLLNNSVVDQVGAPPDQLLTPTVVLYYVGQFAQDVRYGAMSPNRISNQIDARTWSVASGAGSQPAFNEHPTSAGGANTRELTSLPGNNYGVAWRASSGASNGLSPEGGWNGAPFPVNPNAMYRFSVWVRCSSGNSGSLYLGLGENAVSVNFSSNSPESNPYFVALGRSALTQGEWYLLVGYVLPANSGAPITVPGGVFSGATGKLVAAPSATYRWLPGARESYHRAYQFYTTAAGTVQHFWAPRADLCDGTEPSLDELLSVGAVSGRNPMTATNVSSFLQSAAITNLYIGNVIQGDDFIEGVRGFRIRKNRGDGFSDMQIDAASILGKLKTNQLEVGAVTANVSTIAQSVEFMQLANTTADQVPGPVDKRMGLPTAILPTKGGYVTARASLRVTVRSNNANVDSMHFGVTLRRAFNGTGGVGVDSAFIVLPLSPFNSAVGSTRQVSFTVNLEMPPDILAVGNNHFYVECDLVRFRTSAAAAVSPVGAVPGGQGQFASLDVYCPGINAQEFLV